MVIIWYGRCGVCGQGILRCKCGIVNWKCYNGSGGVIIRYGLSGVCVQGILRCICRVVDCIHVTVGVLRL